MNIDIKTTGIELTPSIKDYVEKKVENLTKFVEHKDDIMQAWVEVGMISKHHNKGEIFRAEIQLKVPHTENGVRAEAESGDLYSAIDIAHDELKLELLKNKEKKISLVRRGARAFKEMIKRWGR